MSSTFHDPVRRFTISWTECVEREVEFEGTADDANDLADELISTKNHEALVKVLNDNMAYIVHAERTITRSRIATIKEPEFTDSTPVNAWDSYTYGN